jgi:hypothetical protein
MRFDATIRSREISQPGVPTVIPKRKYSRIIPLNFYGYACLACLGLADHEG